MLEAIMLPCVTYWKSKDGERQWNPVGAENPNFGSVTESLPLGGLLFCLSRMESMGIDIELLQPVLQRRRRHPKQRCSAASPADLPIALPQRVFDSLPLILENTGREGSIVQ